MSIEIFHGYILKVIPYSESDVIAHIFTKEMGKISIFIKSYRRSKKRFQGTIDRYLYNEFEIDLKEEGRLSILKSCKIIDPLINLRKFPAKLVYAEHASEIFLNVLHADKEEFDEFDRILRFIEFVDEIRYSHLLAIRFNILKRAGIMPFLEDIEDNIYSTTNFRFSSTQGSIMITKKQAEFFLLYQDDDESLFNYTFNDDEKRVFGRIFSTLYYSITPKKLVTITLLKEFI